jgi:hypothetical protein
LTYQCNVCYHLLANISIQSAPGLTRASTGQGISADDWVNGRGDDLRMQFSPSVSTAASNALQAHCVARAVPEGKTGGTRLETAAAGSDHCKLSLRRPNGYNYGAPVRPKVCEAQTPATKLRGGPGRNVQMPNEEVQFAQGRDNVELTTWEPFSSWDEFEASRLLAIRNIADVLRWRNTMTCHTRGRASPRTPASSSFRSHTRSCCEAVAGTIRYLLVPEPRSAPCPSVAAATP